MARKEFGADEFEIIYPSLSILAEPPVSLVDQVVDKRGTRKVAEAYLPLDASQDDFEAIAKRIKDTQPSFIFSTVVGDGTALLHRAYAKRGLDPQRMPIASLTTSEAEVGSLLSEVDGEMHGFERIADEDEGPAETVKKGRKAPAKKAAKPKAEKSAKEKAPAKKKTTRSKKAAAGDENSEGLADAEASVSESGDRAEMVALAMRAGVIR